MSDKHFSYLVVRVNSERCRNQGRKFPPSITQANLQINLSRTDFGCSRRNKVVNLPGNIYSLSVYIDRWMSLELKKMPPPKYWVLYNFLTVRQVHWGDELFYFKCVETHCSQKMVLKPIWVLAVWSVGDARLCNTCWFILLDITGSLNPESLSTHKLWIYLSNLLMPTGKRMSMVDWCIGNC